MPDSAGSQTPASLRRSENSSSSIANNPLYSNLQNPSLASTPRHSILRNGDLKNSPQSSNGTPRSSIRHHVELNNNRQILNAKDEHNTPIIHSIRIDESDSGKNDSTDDTPSTSIQPEDRVRRSLTSSTYIGRSSSIATSRARQSILRIGDIEGHNGNRPYNILMDFLIFCVTSLEVTVVLMLALLHFQHEDGLMAITMLLPIVLNCVGVVYFLSDSYERQEMERAGRITCLTDFLQFPVLGPVFTAFKVLSISCGCSNYDNYERMEAIAVKLRQAGGFFSAAPETLIILTVMYSIEQDENFDITDIQYLEMGAVLLFTFTLAESNCYGSLSNYYKMWTDHESRDWRLEDVYLWQKLMLFLHSFTSIASKIIASAAIKSAVLYYWTPEDFTVVLITTVFGEIGVRIVLHYIFRQLKFLISDHEVPSSCYEAINYGWRSTILNLGFQSQNLFVQFVFYLENLICFGIWVISACKYGEAWVTELLLVPNCILFVSVTGLSMLLLITCGCLGLIKLHGPCKGPKAMSDHAKSQIIIEFARSTSVP